MRQPPVSVTDCRHNRITVFKEEGGYHRMWGCATCDIRFYPACLTCVDVGHRNEVHVEDPAIGRLRRIEEVATQISRRTYVDEGVVAHVPYATLYALRQALFGSDDEIVAALDRLER